MIKYCLKHFQACTYLLNGTSKEKSISRYEEHHREAGVNSVIVINQPKKSCTGLELGTYVAIW